MNFSRLGGDGWRRETHDRIEIEFHGVEPADRPGTAQHRLCEIVLASLIVGEDRFACNDRFPKPHVSIEIARQRAAASEDEAVGFYLAAGLNLIQIKLKGLGRRLVLIRALGRQPVEFFDLELERRAVAERKQFLFFDEAMNLVGRDAEMMGGFFDQQKFTGHGAFGFARPVPTIRSKTAGRRRGDDIRPPIGVDAPIVRVHHRRHTRAQPIFPAGPLWPVISAFPASFSGRPVAAPGS